MPAGGLVRSLFPNLFPQRTNHSHQNRRARNRCFIRGHQSNRKRQMAEGKHQGAAFGDIKHHPENLVQRERSE
ncbi:unnamed protein product [Meloidogyne enterolobii]|uniref:Uncharacterized protein n=1 Tax=Meloidogyne enterolobii TaxID=390850 RepID=A0ACB0ZQQ5_MELEN